jgi:hypothetical protein
MHTSASHHIYDRLLSLFLYDLRTFDVPCVALFSQLLPSFSRPFTTALVMDMLNLTHDDTLCGYLCFEFFYDVLSLTFGFPLVHASSDLRFWLK